MSWPFAQVTSELALTVTTDQPAYAAGEPVALKIAIANRSASAFELDAPRMQRRARVLFMERSGGGELRIRLTTLFGRSGLRIDPGQQQHWVLRLRGSDRFDRFRTEHYEFTPDVRTFQLFLPLATEDARDFDHMLSVSVAAVDVADEWSDASAQLGLVALLRLLWRRLRVLLGMR